MRIATTATAESAAMKMKVACHPSRCPITVPSGTPIRVELEMPNNTVESARPRRSAGANDIANA